MTIPKLQVYFLCTGNSCRSQMAEGYARKYHPEWDIQSAGLEKHGLNPRAVQTMLMMVLISVIKCQHYLMMISYLALT